jgi:hypothetical protein
MKISYIVLSALLLLLPLSVSAELPNLTCPGASGVNCTNYGNISLFIAEIIMILLSIAGMIAVLFIIIGGFQYITSGANQELAEAGKKTLRNAIIGIVVIVLSFVIVRVISNTFS